MATVRDAIKRSLRIIGVLASGETPSAEDSSDALSSFIAMLDSWSTEGLTVPDRTREEFTLTGGQQAYTLGPTGDFETTRPQKIEHVAILSGGVEYTVQIVTLEEWACIPVKNTQSTIPEKVYIEGTYPNETLNFWPVPSGAVTFVLHSRKPFSTLTINDELTFQKGYEDAIVYNLAVRLSPEYGRAVDPTVFDLAKSTKANIKRMNIKPQYLHCDPAVLPMTRKYDFISGE